MKQVNLDEDLRARLKSRAPDVDPEKISVFRAAALSTAPVRKKHPVYNGAVHTKNFLSQMLGEVQKESRPVQIMHGSSDGDQLPIGRVFDGQLSIGTGVDGADELRTLFWIDNTHPELIAKVNSGTIDQVSVAILGKAVKSTRALFPEVVDDVVRSASRQVDYENLESLIASSRTINGVEMISTVINDENPDDYKVFGPVSEYGRFRIGSIKTSETRVKMWKLGGGYRTSYEFQRRARLDLLTPYAARMTRELNLSKVGLVTDLLINGDTVNAPANVKYQYSYDDTANGRIGVATAGRISYKHLLAWFVERAKKGVPIDTVVGNWDAYLDWLFLFALPTTNGPTRTDAENLAATGFRIGGVPILNGQVNFVLSTTAPAGQLIGYRKAETVEALTEAGSLINESERAIQTQSITYVKSEVTGYRIAQSKTDGNVRFDRLREAGAFAGLVQTTAEELAGVFAELTGSTAAQDVAPVLIQLTAITVDPITGIAPAARVGG